MSLPLPLNSPERLKALRQWQADTLARTVERITYRTELTPIGEQLVIPGCERQPVAGKPAQLSLFGG